MMLDSEHTDFDSLHNMVIENSDDDLDSLYYRAIFDEIKCTLEGSQKYCGQDHIYTLLSAAGHKWAQMVVAHQSVLKGDYETACELYIMALEDDVRYFKQDNFALYYFMSTVNFNILSNEMPGLSNIVYSDQIEYTQIKAESGDQMSLMKLAGNYRYGIGVDKDLSEAFRLMESTELNTMNDGLTNYLIGTQYLKGYLVD